MIRPRRLCRRAALLPLLLALAFVPLLPDARAQDRSAYLDVLPELPLVTVGVEPSGRWDPSGDEFEFTLETETPVRLWLYSAGFDEGRQGDEALRAAPGAALAWFALHAPDRPGGPEVLTRGDFGPGASDWQLLWDAPLPAGRYVLTSDVEGPVKNVYLPLLELAGEPATLRSVRPTVNVADEVWRPAVGFELTAPDVTAVGGCELALYDAEGESELNARLRTPAGGAVPLELPGDREWVRAALPAAPGRYLVEVRQPVGAVQRSNAVRFMALCSDGPRPLEVITGQTLLEPARPVPRPAATVAVAPARPVPLPEVRAERLPPPARPVPLPEPSVELRPAAETPSPAAPSTETESAPPAAAAEARLVVTRAFDPAPSGPCDPVAVAFTVRNEGGAEGAYELFDVAPAGWRVTSVDGARSGQPRWRGRLEPGAVATHRYTVTPPDGAGGSARFEATLLTAAGSERSDADLAIVAPSAALLAPGVLPVAGRPFEATLRIVDPLARPRALTPRWSADNLALEGAPDRFELPAGGVLERTLTLTPGAAGSARLRVDLGCGARAELTRGVAAAPALPTPSYRTVVTVDLAAWRLPARSDLVLVQHLPVGARYLPGSGRVDGARLEPQRVRGALLFELPERTAASVAFEVVHAGAFDAAAAGSSVLARTPRPTLLLGDEADLALLEEAGLPPLEVALPRSGDAVILEPAPGALLRFGRSAAVSVETPLGSSVALLLGGERVADDRLAERIYDQSAGRQRFRYLGLRLAPGPNRLELRALGRDGRELSDEVTVYAPGPASSVEAVPLEPLVADSALPLRLELRVVDAWGNPPDDGALTVEIDGAEAAQPDRAPQQLGYQLAVAGGRAELQLLPVATPRALRLRFFDGERLLGESDLVVGSDLDAWLALGQASAAAGWRLGGEDAGAWFGVEGRAFARGPVFGDALFTVAASAPLNELEPVGDPYADFPVPGSSARDRREAVSRHGVYARLERDLDYLQYGDFRPEFEGELLRPGGAPTGLSGRVAGELAGAPFAVTGYAALAPLRGEVRVEIPSDGTSTPGPLPQAPIAAGSLELEVVKRDRDDPRLELDDGDPRLGPLTSLVDYTVIEESGFVQLARLLPMFDANGNRYYLRAAYRSAAGGGGPFGVQAGGQFAADVGPATVRVGGYHASAEGGGWARVLSASTRVETGGLTLDAEAAWGVAGGGDEASAGAAVRAGAAWRGEGGAAEVRWRWQGEDYRAADVPSGDGAGHGVSARALVEVAPGLGIGADADLATERSDAGTAVRLGGGAGLRWQGSGALRIGGVHLANSPSAELGVAWRGAPYLNAGLGLRDLAGVPGAELELRHQQSLGAEASTSDVSAGYRVGDWLTLRAGQRITWGRGSRLFVGVEAGADHATLLGSLCADVGCAALAADRIPGRSVVSAELELPGGLPGASGRALLGLDTTLPVGDALAFDLHLEREIGLVAPDRPGSENPEADADPVDPGVDATVAALGARWEAEAFDASVRYEVRFADVTKHTLSGGVGARVGDAFTVALRGVAQRASGEPDLGLRVTAAAAYRGPVDVLARHEIFRGPLAGGDDRIEGDTRLLVPLGPSPAGALDLQASYLYSVRPEVGWQDLTGLGIVAHPWRGGSVSASAQLFHDWTQGEWLPGAALELSQHLGCGVHGALGGTAFSGRPSAGATLREPGVYLRVDVVVDESWRCGRGSVAGRVIGEDGAPVAGARLLLRRAGGAEVGAEAGRAVSDDAGGYRFARLEPGRYALEVVPPRGWSTADPDPLEIDLAPSAQRRLPDLLLVREAP